MAETPHHALHIDYAVHRHRWCCGARGSGQGTRRLAGCAQHHLAVCFGAADLVHVSEQVYEGCCEERRSGIGIGGRRRWRCGLRADAESLDHCGFCCRDLGRHRCHECGAVGACRAGSGVGEWAGITARGRRSLIATFRRDVMLVHG